jgi:heavy metal sensor kinase
MKKLTFRGRVALWSVAVATVTLTLFGAGAAWNLRRELMENVDREIGDAAEAFVAELDEQLPPPGRAQNAIAFSPEDLPRFPYVEVSAGSRLLYRSPSLGNNDVLAHQRANRSNDLVLQSHRIRFRSFRRGDITFALGKDLLPVEEALAGLLHSYLITLPLVVLVVGAGGWLIADRAVAPIQRITAQAARISASDLDQRMPPPPAQDEIARLTNVLNEMFDRLQRSFEQVKRFTSDASHELKTPLALMKAEVENALESESLGSEQRQLLADVSDQCFRLSQIVDGLLFLSRADDRHLILEQKPVSLVMLVRELWEDAEILAEPAGLTLQCQLPDEVMTRGDRRLLAQAVMNLVDNAIKHNRVDGQVTIMVSAENDEAVLSIGNTGAGLAAGAGEQVFDRFYRGDPSHSNETPGHGLGLSIAREIARAHGGDVTLVRSEPEWTEFCLVLPLLPAATLAERERETDRSAQHSTLRQG